MTLYYNKGSITRVFTKQIQEGILGQENSLRANQGTTEQMYKNEGYLKLRKFTCAEQFVA